MLNVNNTRACARVRVRHPLNVLILISPDQVCALEAHRLRFLVYHETMTNPIAPEVDEHTVADDLRTITRLAALQGHPTVGGGLGGTYGYGAVLDTPALSMHPYCWCERPECAWCCVCSCPWDAWLYFDAYGNAIDGEAYIDNMVESRGGSTQVVVDKQCARCREQITPAPNFHHVATGVKVWWYKYIGRGMKIDCPDQETWDQVFLDTLKRLREGENDDRH